jgi:hypothetical protein
MSLTEAQRLKKIALEGRDDLYFFCRTVLGNDKMRPKPHKELSTFVKSSDARKKLILMPRGSFKSTMVTVGYTLQKLVRDPDQRVLIASETQSKAIKFVKEIKGHIEGNAKFQGLYGDWRNKGNTWKENEFIIKPRRAIKKEPSVMAGSLEKGSAGVGLHFDTIVIDDPVSMSTINSQDQIQKTIDFYKLLLSILEPDGELIVIGTRWGAYELYGWLMDQENPESQNVDVFHRSAEDGEGNLLMPEVLTREFLDEMKQTQGSYIYECQYQNKITNRELATFKQEDIQLYKETPSGLIWFMTVDPAASQKAAADPQGIMIVGTDFDHNWYVERSIEFKGSQKELMDQMFSLQKKFNPIMALGMQKFALEKLLKENMMLRMQETDEFLPIVEIPTNTKISKDARIRSLAGRSESKKIFIRDTEENKALIYQMLTHPGCKHDDLLDCLQMMQNITFPSDNKPERDQVKDLSHLSARDRREWEHVRSLSKRKVKRKEEFIL